MALATATHDESLHPADGARHADVLICGGGITGLSLATWLQREGIDVQVLDRNPRPGGVIATLHQDGFIFERGPNTVLDKFPSLEELIALADLESEILRVPLRSQPRHVWLAGCLHQVPTGPGAFLRTPLLPWSAKLALLREPFISVVADDESIADFVRRRLGEAWLRNLITPMVSGIWAGDPARLSIAHAFPVMKEMERDGGSLIAGAIGRMRRGRAQRRSAPRQSPARRHRRGRNMISFRGGLQRLPEALAAGLGARYHGGVAIESIKSVSGGGYRVRCAREGRQQDWLAQDVVVAAEADQAASWLAPLDTNLAATLRHVPYARLTSIALGIRSTEACLPPGFGFLAPRGEGLRILGAIINSNFLPDRAPVGCASLSIFVGGELDPGGAELDDEELLAVLRADLKQAIGWRGDPVALHVERWPRAIPQYDMAHGLRMKAIEAAEERWLGLHLMGNWRGGVSIGDRVELTRVAAARLLAARRERNSA